MSYKCCRWWLSLGVVYDEDCRKQCKPDLYGGQFCI